MKLLSLVVTSLFLLSTNGLGVACSQNKSCPSRLQESSHLESSLKIIETIQKDKNFQSFLRKSSEQRDGILESKEFQDVVAALQAQTSLQSSQSSTGITENTSTELMLFVSFSMGEKALLNLAHEAKQFGATVVLRGFKDGSYLKTVQSLQKIIQETGQGFMIDPELFSLFSITVVPTYVLSKPFQLQAQEHTQTPHHDRLRGHASISYALGVFAKEGSLKEDASSLLENASLEKGRSK